MLPHCESLPNGLRVLMVPCEAESVAVGFFIGSGSRHESEKFAGISHFLEHMLFKGTRHRRQLDITRAIEGRGGYFNACTSEEGTCFYVHIPSERLVEALDILSDMFEHAEISASEFAREKLVILEEIKMYADQPDSVAMDSLRRCLFPKSRLGAPIAGTEQSLLPMTATDLRKHLKEHYRADNTVVVLAGNLGKDGGQGLLRVNGQVYRMLSKLGRGRHGIEHFDRAGAGKPCQLCQVVRDVSQVQLALGYRTFGNRDPRRYALSIIDALLGRGMSSRLFQEIREKRALAYEIDSHTQYFRDAGMLVISAGLDGSKRTAVLSTIDREIAKLCEKKVSVAELKRIKEFIIGTSRLSFERMLTKMFHYGSAFMTYGQVVSLEDQIEQIMKVDAEAVRTTARSVFVPANRAVSWVLPKNGI